MTKTKPPLAPSFVELRFPVGGLDLSRAFDRQAPGTTSVGLNVRAYEPGTGSARGGQRPGLVKYIAGQVSGSNLIQELAAVVGVGYSPPGGSMETSQSGRIVTLVAVSQGNVRVANAGATSWTTPTGGNGALNSTGIIASAVNQAKMWFADGTHWKYYQPSDNTVHAWTASAGSLPVDSAGNAPRHICTWRGRTVLSGLLKDPQNWFMSKVNDPTNWDYGPVSVAPDQAIAGNNSPNGLIGDVVTTLIPYTDDIMFVGGDHTLWMFNGDPMAGGQIDLVSDSIGTAWGAPWCKDPYGAIYFVSNRMGIYKLTPPQTLAQSGVGGSSGSGMQRISQPIEPILAGVDTGANTIRLLWDDRFQGLHVFISPTGAAAATTHYFWEQRSQAWWKDQFGSVNQDPLCCCVFDGNSPSDRVSLIGSWDGYVRSIDPSATTDDGTAIPSSVAFGPILTKDLDDVMIQSLQGILGASSGTVTYAIYVGATAEIALASSAILTGTWTAGRNLSSQIHRSGHAVYVIISATNPWAMEAIRAAVKAEGRVRQRGY